MHCQPRYLAVTLALASALAVVSASTADAQYRREYKWCAWIPIPGSGASSQCGFDTLEQCRMEVHGLGGWCNLNPYYNAAVEERAHRAPPRRQRSGAQPY